MTRYVATFHTHLAALRTWRALLEAGVAAEMAPVPRALSADCGTCVRFQADSPCRALMHRDFAQVAEVLDDDNYRMVVSNDAP